MRKETVGSLGSSYYFETRNTYYHFDPINFSISEIESINEGMEFYLSSRIQTPLSMFSISKHLKVNFENDSNSYEKQWIHVNIVSLKKNNNQLQPHKIIIAIEQIIMHFKDLFLGITIGLELSDSYYNDMKALELIIQYFEYIRSNYIESYPYLYLKKSVLTYEMSQLINKYKCCWEIKLYEEINFEDKLFDINNLSLINSYLNIKTRGSFKIASEEHFI